MGPDAPGVVTTARAKPITIHGTRITGSSTSFPVWIDVTDAQLGAGASAAGDDLFFTDGGNVVLPFEITSWSKPAMHLQAWVRAPSLVAGTDTVIYLRYGDAAAAVPPSPPTVFANGFAAVWHLDDKLAAAAVVDATGTTAGTAAHLGMPAAVAGVLQGGVHFNGNDSAITFANPFVGASGASSHTISAWVIAGTEAQFGAIMILGTAAPDQARWFHLNYGGLSVGFYGGDWMGAGAAVTNTTKLVHWVYDAPTKQSTVYVDGAPTGGAHAHDFSPASNIATTGAVGTIGNGPKIFGPGGNTFPANDGTLDEVRIATVTRSAGWIATEYANQHDPQTFYTVGAEQAAP